LYCAGVRLAIGTIALLLGLALYALLAMRLAVAVLPEGVLVQTLFYLAAGLAWVWPAALVVRWIQRARP
jgi:Protein of unknown function (DUF2842)